jgi:MFS family permease
MRGLRQAAYGMLAIVLAVSLTDRGLSPAAIGALVTVSLAGDFAGTLVIGRWADAWGRRRTLTVLAVVMALTGLIFGVLGWYPLLLVVAFCGTLGTSASETAPFLPIEQAMLAQVGPSHGRTALFARYNLVASLAGALGALAAGLPDLLVRHGVAARVSLFVPFALYALAALVVAWLAAHLSPAVEAHDSLVARKADEPEAVSAVADAPPAAGQRRSPWHRLPLPVLGASRGMVLRLAGLYSVDAFAGGFVTQTLLALFFHLRFGIPLDTLAVLFFGANLLAALSFLAAPALARRFGLLNTMVFTHLPSNVLLVLVPLMPTFPLAAITLLLRQTLSQLDVPTRQAYTMALVEPGERTATASVTSLARSAGSASSPVLAGALLQGPLVVLGLPLLVAGGLKAIYDLALWRIFRRVPQPDAPHRSTGARP